MTAYIDRIITCFKPKDNIHLLNLVSRQVHSHSHTCCKNTSSQCQFNYPQPPLKQTIILWPLDKNTPVNEIKMYKDNQLEICQKPPWRYERRWRHLLLIIYSWIWSMKEENYLLAIRLSRTWITSIWICLPSEVW